MYKISSHELSPVNFKLILITFLSLRVYSTVALSKILLLCIKASLLLLRFVLTFDYVEEISC